MRGQILTQKIPATFAIIFVLLTGSSYSADIDKKDHHAQKEIERLELQLSAATAESDRAALQNQITEIRSAIQNNHRPSIPPYVDLAEFPILLVDALNNPIAKGTKPAINLPAHDPNLDLSRLDPISSTFWGHPASIRNADLRAGFDRTELPNYNTLWSYFAPKRSGCNPGCVVTSKEGRLKIKFAEIHSEPFASRIFHALGYNVDPTDYSPGLKIKYDRRFFEEFNSRRPMKMNTGMFFIPIVHFDLQNKFDPFAFIDHVLFQNGSTATGDQFKALLLDHEQFKPDIETQIDYLVTKPVNVQIEPAHTHNLGPWDFGGHDHEHLRELRGAGLLAAWLGWWDSRFENTRLRIIKTPDGPALKHFWTDLGGGLGRAHGTFSHSCEDPHGFPWSFTRSSTVSGKLHFQIRDYEPIEDTPAFAEMTIDDARWMARLIAQLTESQIITALEASGFKPAEVKIYSDKLISRRDHLIRDLQLTSEIALLRPDAFRHTAHADPPKLISKSR